MRQREDKAEDQTIKRYERLYRRVRAQGRAALSLAAVALVLGSGLLGVAVYSGLHSPGGVSLVYKAGASSSAPTASPTTSTVTV
ncbi:MAG TPA: hypothetical protein VMV23_01525, partial [Candidatus Nanopelagicaceae bacterium]|nr:hypothetical protein [Candidatus Nanopelagicaceae bacterium]